MQSNCWVSSKLRTSLHKIKSVVVISTIRVVRGLIDIGSCTTNVYKLDAYAGAHRFDPELPQYASRISSPCGLTVVYKMSTPLNWASRDIACTEWNRQ